MPELHSQLDAVHGRGAAEISLHLAGLEELIPGAVWTGTEAQIKTAIDAAERRTEGTNQKVAHTRDDAGKWTLEISGRTFQIRERAESPHAAKGGGKVALAGHDLRLQDVAAWVTPMEGTLDVIVHSDADTFSMWRDGDWIDIDHRRLANYIRSKAGNKYKRIRLVACHAGAHPDAIAQHLANKANKEVLASTDAVTAVSDGTLVSGPDQKTPTGRWQSFMPGRPSQTRQPEGPVHEPSREPADAERGPAEWVDENAHMSEEARDYNDGAHGARSNRATKSPQAPELEYTNEDGKVQTVRFDGVEGRTMIDRKKSVTTFPKSERQALRQSEALRQNGLTAIWEVPNEREAARAIRMLEKLGITNITTRVVKL